MQPKSTWPRILSSSILVSAIALAAGRHWQADPVELLIAQFFIGATAGWFARRHGWFSGIVVGLPFGIEQLTHAVMREYPSPSVFLTLPDYWRLLIPASIVSCGMAVMGSMAGAWMQDMKLHRGR